jgi:hypothetical protein
VTAFSESFEPSVATSRFLYMSCTPCREGTRSFWAHIAAGALTKINGPVDRAKCGVAAVDPDEDAP